MSDLTMERQWKLLRDLPDSQIQWFEEVVTSAGIPVHRCHAAGTPAQAIDRWRHLLFCCRNHRHWYAARLTILDDHPD